MEAFTGLDDVPAAREKLTRLRETRDAKRARLEELQRAAAPAVTVTAADWDGLTRDEQRALITDVIESATVAPGRGEERVTVMPRTSRSSAI